MDRNDLRIGDAEREQTMAALREHFAQGRLTHEELEERLDRTLAAKTARDLASITADLPGPGYRTPAPQPDMGDWRAAMHAHRQQMQEMRHAHRDMRHAWRHHHPRRRHGGPHPIVPLLFVAMMLGLFFGGFGVFKVLLAVWVVAVVASMVRRRIHHRR
ncbi:DUF1707 SHOCT-like domain-containing protein [Nonomuraea sp. KM88]|uniref:DUF1707 SHOCT-like domain-containing protein n=1 Tax=Nonomuraea sp. KM88 TaxID=3457427 RepID=UPI003FCEBDC2